MSTKTPSINNMPFDFMPKGAEAEYILMQRAMILSKPLKEKKEVTDEVAYVCFRLSAQQYYGIPYQDIAEVKELGALTKIPLVPDFVAGVLNWRGRIISVIDLKKLFHLENIESKITSQIIVVRHRSLLVGILADEIMGDEIYGAEDLAPSIGSPGSIKAGYVLGLHKGINAILNIKNILSDIENSLSQKT